MSQQKANINKHIVSAYYLLNEKFIAKDISEITFPFCFNYTLQDTYLFKVSIKIYSIWMYLYDGNVKIFDLKFGQGDTKLVTTYKQWTFCDFKMCYKLFSWIYDSIKRE